MQEKDLINKIKGLGEIKPNQEWASLLKSQILTPVVNVEEKKIGFAEIVAGFFLQKRFAMATATLAVMIMGVFGFVNYTMPGDVLYPVRKVAEQAQKTPLQIAYNRSEDLITAVKENKTQNITPAITEFKASISDAVKDLTDSLNQSSGNRQSVKQIAVEVEKLRENQDKLKTLGIDMSGSQEMSELESALAMVVENQINDLQQATLTEDQIESLEEIKTLNTEGRYSEALEIMLQMEK